MGPPQQKRERGPGSSFQRTMHLLQHQDQPLIQYYCSLPTAHPATSVTKWDRFIKQCPLFPTSQVHLQRKPHLHAAVTGITASLGTGSSRVLSLETSSAGISNCPCWSCGSSACCQLGLQFFGSHELRRRVDERKSKQEIKGYNSGPNFVSSVPDNFCLNRLALRNHARYTTVEWGTTNSFSLCSQQGRKRHLQLFSKS